MAETTKKETKTVKSSSEKTGATKTAAPKSATAKAATTKTATTAKAVEAKVDAKPATAETKKPAALKETKTNGPKIKVTLVKSYFGRLEKQQKTLVALGLKKTGSSNIVPDNAATRGMIFVVKHLVKVENV